MCRTRRFNAETLQSLVNPHTHVLGGNERPREEKVFSVVAVHGQYVLATKVSACLKEKVS